MIFGRRDRTQETVDRVEARHDLRQRDIEDVTGKPKPRSEPAPAYVQTNDDPLKVGGPIPPTMGITADLYRDVRELRLMMEKEVEVVKAREKELKDYLINNLSKSDDTGAAGKRFRAQIVMKDVPQAKDWPAIHKFIRDNDRFDLLQKRLGEKAVMDMYADNQRIPGVEIAHIPDVSITKI